MGKKWLGIAWIILLTSSCAMAQSATFDTSLWDLDRNVLKDRSAILIVRRDPASKAVAFQGFASDPRFKSNNKGVAVYVKIRGECYYGLRDVANGKSFTRYAKSDCVIFNLLMKAYRESVTETRSLDKQ